MTRPAIHVGDTVILKKKHPCGCDRFLILRTGADVKFKCLVCRSEIMLHREKAEKAIRTVLPPTPPS